jgi:hypothetical protein
VGSERSDSELREYRGMWEYEKEQKGVVGNVFCGECWVMLEVNGDVVGVRRVVVLRNCGCQMMRG